MRWWAVAAKRRLVAAHLWRRSMEYGLRLIALVAGGLLATIDSTDPERGLGWLDLAQRLAGWLLTAIVCWKLANGMQRVPQAVVGSGADRHRGDCMVAMMKAQKIRCGNSGKRK